MPKKIEQQDMPDINSYIDKVMKNDEIYKLITGIAENRSDRKLFEKIFILKENLRQMLIEVTMNSNVSTSDVMTNIYAINPMKS